MDTGTRPYILDMLEGKEGVSQGKGPVAIRRTTWPGQSAESPGLVVGMVQVS